MTYESLSEIFSFIGDTRVKLLERVASLTAEQENARTDSNGWSVKDIIEHLSIVEKQILRLSTLMLMKAEAAGETASPDGRIGPISLDKIAERASREKYQAPDTSLPIGATVGESLSLMRVSRDALNELRPRLEKADLSSVSYPHPAFGPLNLYEWLVMLGFHEERHLRQMDVVLSI